MIYDAGVYRAKTSAGVNEAGFPSIANRTE